MKSLRIHRIALSLLVGLSVGCTSTGFAQNVAAEDPFIPFSKPGDLDGEQPTGPKAPGRTSARISDETESTEHGFWPSFPKPKMPSLPKLSLPSWTTTERAMPRERMHQPEEPSTWSKVTGGTKDLFSKTKQTLMPWTQNDEEATVRRPVPPRRTAPKASNRTKAHPASNEKKSFFSWFSSKEEEKQPTTVNDFLAQPRLK